MPCSPAACRAGLVDAAEIKVGHTTVIDRTGKLAGSAIAKAGTATDGYLSAADWNIFNKKLALDANNRLALADSGPMNPSILDQTSGSLVASIRGRTSPRSGRRW